MGEGWEGGLSIAGNRSQIVVGEIIISCNRRSHILNWVGPLRRCQSIRQTQCTCQGCPLSGCTTLEPLHYWYIIWSSVGFRPQFVAQLMKSNRTISIVDEGSSRDLLRVRSRRVQFLQHFASYLLRVRSEEGGGEGTSSNLSHNPMFVCISHRRQAAIMSLKRQLFADWQQSGHLPPPPPSLQQREVVPKWLRFLATFDCRRLCGAYELCLAVESHSWALHFATATAGASIVIATV